MREKCFVGLAFQGKDIIIVFRFIIGYSSLRDFKVMGLFLCEEF
jgi:hypothetical protein